MQRPEAPTAVVAVAAVRARWYQRGALQTHESSVLGALARTCLLGNEPFGRLEVQGSVRSRPFRLVAPSDGGASLGRPRAPGLGRSVTPFTAASDCSVGDYFRFRLHRRPRRSTDPNHGQGFFSPAYAIRAHAVTLSLVTVGRVAPTATGRCGSGRTSVGAVPWSGSVHALEDDRHRPPFVPRLNGSFVGCTASAASRDWFTGAGRSRPEESGRRLRSTCAHSGAAAPPLSPQYPGVRPAGGASRAEVDNPGDPEIVVDQDVFR